MKMSLQLDETADVLDNCKLLALMRYVKNGHLQEFIFCEDLKTTSSGKEATETTWLAFKLRLTTILVRTRVFPYRLLV